MPQADDTRRYWWMPGTLALLVIVLFIVLPLATLINVAGDLDASRLFSPWIRQVLGFTLYQAALSTLLSVLFALPVALALARQNRFPGRGVLLSLFSMPMILPTVVAIVGIVAVFGRQGWLNDLLAVTGSDKVFRLYGLSGILIAHVFFNLPLATRVLLQSLEQIPAAQQRVAVQLGMRPLQWFMLVQWPFLRSQLPGLSVLIFSLCFTSFAIILTLGGGPKASTLEVAIYQALRFDFDLSLAVQLALLQLFIGVGVVLLALMLKQSPMPEVYNPGDGGESWFRTPWLNVLDTITIAGSWLLFLLPVVGVVITAINPEFIVVLTHSTTVKALWNTLWVAACAAVLSVMLGSLALLSSRHLIVRERCQRCGQLLEMSMMIGLLVSPVVLSAGLFLLLRDHADVFALGLFLVIVVNALTSLPFVIRILAPRFLSNAQNQDKLADSLGVRAFNRFVILEWPLLRRPVSLALALSATFSAGDLTAIAMFGSDRAVTLPLLLYQRMGSYRMYEASATALLLLIVCLLVFLFLDALGRSDADRG